MSKDVFYIEKTICEIITILDGVAFECELIGTKYQRAAIAFEQVNISSSALSHASDTMNSCANFFRCAKSGIDRGRRGYYSFMMNLNIACSAFQDLGFQLQGFGRSLHTDWRKLVNLYEGHNQRSPSSEAGFYFGSMSEALGLIGSLPTRIELQQCGEFLRTSAQNMKNFATRTSDYRQSWIDGNYEKCAEILLDSASHLLEIKTLSQDELMKMLMNTDTILT